MKIALVHDWLTGMRGGEKVLEGLCELYPKADIYTLIHIPKSVSSIIESHRIYTSFLQRFPDIERRYRWYLPLMPFAIERFDLSKYDLIISSSHCVAKGVRKSKNSLHICFCHTPMRYIWDMYDEYFGKGRSNILVRLAMQVVRPYLRKWDIKSSNRVDFFIANSRHVKRRIKRYYGRDSVVINPPVDVGSFKNGKLSEDFYLIVSAFAPYKRIDIAVSAFNELGLSLKIIGKGQDEKRLKKMARSNIEFLGWQDDEALRDYYARCKAFIFPGEEDFGITPLEAQACGKPVIAYRGGGALETVIDETLVPPRDRDKRLKTGKFFYPQDKDALVKAVKEFNPSDYDPDIIRKHALKFDKSVFKKKIKEFVDKSFKEFISG